MDKKSLLAALKEKIAQAESKGNYNAYNQGKAIPKSGNLTELTLEELMKRQALKKGDKNRVFAAGKYQVIPDTLKEAVAKMKLDTKEKFSPELQEKLFEYLIQQKRPNIGKFLEGKATPEQAAQDLSQEWASMPMLSDNERGKRGESYYKGVGGNKAKVKPEEIEALLSQYKALKQPIPMEAPAVDPVKAEQDAAFQRLVQQPQIPLIAESNYADGGFEKSLQDFDTFANLTNRNSGVFPYRSPEDAELAKQEVEELQQANLLAQTRETGLPEQKETPVEETPVVPTISNVEPEKQEDPFSKQEELLKKIMDLKKQQKIETDAEYADKEKSARWKDAINAGFAGLDKAFAHYGAANPNAMLKPVLFEHEKPDSMDKLKEEKGVAQKSREKVIDEILSKGGEALTPYQKEILKLKEKGLTLSEERANKTQSRFESEKERKEKDQETRIKQQQINTMRGILKDDKVYNKAIEQSMEFDVVDDLINAAQDGNQAALQALGTKMARAMGEVGVLTDTDVTRYVGGTSWGRKLSNWYAKGMEGDLDPDVIADLRANVGLIKKHLDDTKNKSFTRAHSRIKAAYPELDDNIIQGVLGYSPQQVSSEPKTEADIDKMTKEELEAFLKK